MIWNIEKVFFQGDSFFTPFKEGKQKKKPFNRPFNSENGGEATRSQSDLNFNPIPTIATDDVIFISQLQILIRHILSSRHHAGAEDTEIKDGEHRKSAFTETLPCVQNRISRAMKRETRVM